jgi:putative lipoprotein
MLGGLAAVLLAAACDNSAPVSSAAPGAGGALRGTVTYRERMALPRGSTVELRLEDVSVADAPAVLLGEQTIVVEEQQVPLAFEVPYAPDAIEPRRTYAVRATIRAPDGTLLFVTAEQQRAFDAAGQPMQPLEIVAQRARSNGDGNGSGVSTGSITGGPWRLTAMSLAGTAEQPVAAGAAYTLEFGSDGRYNGRADCNRYAGSYERPAPERLAMSAGLATLAACPPGSIADDFIRAVATAASFRVTGEMLRLELANGGYLLFVRESEPPAAAAAPEVGRTFVFDCDGDVSFTIRTGPGEVALWLPAALGGAYRVLSLAMSASGARYVEGDIELWNKGDLATFDVAGRRFVDCRSNPAKVPWADAARRGVQFRALGNEPSWYVEVLNDRFAIVTELGTQRVELPYAAPVVDGATTTYRGSGSPVTVEVERRACNDTMSGEAFEASATVTLEDRVLTGCGRFL